MSTLVNPLASFQAAQSNVQGLQDMRQLAQARAQQVQLGQQEYKLNDLKLKAANQDFEESDAINKALSSNTSPDGQLNRQGVVNTLSQQGKGKAAAGLISSWTKQDADNAKAQGEAQKLQISNALEHVKLTGQLLQGATDPASYAVARAKAMATGNFKPNEIPEQYDPNFVQQALNQTMTQKDTLEAHAKILDQQLRGLEIGATQARDAETARYHNVESKQRSQEIGIQGARLNLERDKQGTDQETAIEQQAQQIANGDVKALSQSRNNPFTRAIMKRVYEINPKYTDSLYTATQDLRSSKPNSMGGNVGRLGTAILHADEALKGSNDLGFSQGLLTGVSTAGTSSYRQSAEFLTGEIGQYVEGGKLTNGQGNDLKKDLFSSRQSVRDAAIHKIIDLSGGKLKSQMEQFKNATTNDFPTDRVFNEPTIKGTLQKHGIIGGDTSTAKASGFDWNAHPEAK